MLVLCGVSGCAVLAGALAFSGPIRFNNLQVHANPVEYSVTFDEDSTVKAVGDNYAIFTTTAGGNKVGVVGYNNSDARFTFNGVSFKYLYLYDSNSLLRGAGAYEFSTITGFAISFSGGSTMTFDGGSTYIDDVVSGHEYTGLSTIPDYFPSFKVMNGSVTVSSLTIMYSC